MNAKTCYICGREFVPTAFNQRRCPDCVSARKMLCKKCGAVYSGSAYNRIGNRSLCPECLSRFRADMHTAQATPQSDEARAKAFEAKSRAGKQNIKRAISVLNTHPHTAKNSHEHQHAKIWHFIAPNRALIDVQNLNAFLAEHSDEFPNTKQSKKQFSIIGRSLRDPDGDFRHQYSYNGWRMTEPPTVPDDVAELKKYRDKLEKRRAEMIKNEEDTHE